MQRPAISALFFITTALQVADNEAVALLAKRMGADLFGGLAVPTVLWLLVVYPVGAALVPLLLTHLRPAIPGRTAVLIGLGLTAAAQGAMAIEPPFAAALAVRTVAGGASGILAFALLSEAARTGPRAVTAMTVGFLTGLIGGMPFAALVADSLGIRGFYALLAAANVALALLYGRALPAGPATPATRRAAAGFRALMQDPGFRRALAASALIAGAIAAPMAVYPTALQTLGGMGLRASGMVFLAAGAGPLLAWPLCNRLVIAHGPFAAARAGAIALVPPVLLLPWTLHPPALTILVLLAALMVETVRRSAMQFHMVKFPGDCDRARFLALRNVFVHGGVAAGRAIAAAAPESSALLIASVAGSAFALAAAALLPREQEDAAGQAPGS